MERETTAVDPESIDIISFQLGEEMYCVDIMAVREIRGWMPCTPVSGAPPHTLGMINLRGTVIPVVDAAVRIGLEPIDPSERSAIIVIDQGAHMFGLLVESVSDMIRIEASNIQPVPDIVPEGEASYVKAIVVLDSGMICFLDPEPLIAGDMAEMLAA